MKITAKHKMKDLPVIMHIVNNSKVDLMTEIMRFDVPKKINGCEVIDFQSISINDMLSIWDIKDQKDLIELTANIFLGLEPESIPELPLIDFLRLTKHTEEKGAYAAKLFQSLHREPKDKRISNILAKYKGSKFDIISRFCEQFPAYTLEQAKEREWVKIYLAFEAKTKRNDIQTEINELQQ